MKFPWMGRNAVVMVLALALASCEHGQTPTDVGGSGESVGGPQELLGLDGLLSSSTTVRAVDQYGAVRTYELVREPLLSLSLNLSVSQLIGGNGGTVTLLGHRIVVPAGAVDLPTVFTLAVLPNGYVQVDVTALAPALSGLVDVGAAGFERPVRLDLSYERATNVKRESRLVILRLNPAGMSELHEALPTTVAASQDQATVWLEHFSGYIMAQ